MDCFQPIDFLRLSCEEGHFLDSPGIINALHPGNQAKEALALRLHLNRYVEFLHNCISSKWRTADRPQEQHGRWKAFGGFCTIIAQDLWEEDDAPEDGSYHTKD